jgi:D-alanyl-D-alanine dipeptidase
MKRLLMICLVALLATGLMFGGLMLKSHPDFCGNPETGEYTGDNSKSPKGRSITEQQFKNRMILRKAMLAHGFKAMPTEWWHFTLKDEPFPNTYFTFPVTTLK